MVTKTHDLKPSRIIVTVLTTAVALVSTMAFLTAVRTQAAPLLSTGNDPEIRLITMTADLPHYDPTASDGITKTVYFSNSVSGVITMTFDISGTQTLTLTAGAAFDEPERIYTSTGQAWAKPITYAVAATHTTQPNIIYTTINTNGITTTVAITYTRDITAPTMSPLISPVSGTTTTTCALHFDWTNADDGTGSGVAGYNFKLNGTAYTTTDPYTQTACLADGAYTWTVRAYDHLDIYSGYTDTWSVTIDTTPPNTPILITPVSGAVVNTTTIAFEWTNESASGAVSYTLDVSGTLYTVSETSHTINLPSDGVYIWTIQSLDTLNNASGYTDTWAVTIDTTPPSTPMLLNPSDGAVTTTCALHFDWTNDGAGSGVAGYNFKLNSTVYTTTNSYTQTACLADGTYTWTVRAYDGIGNYGDYATARTLRIGYFYVYLPLTLRNHAPFNNGSFEAGLAGWQEAESPLTVSVVSSIQERPSGSTSPADGDKALLLGNTSYQCTSVPIGHAAVEQTFSVPQDASNLTFKYIIWSQDASMSEKYDRFEVYINNSLAFSDGNQVNTGLSCDKWRRVPGSGWATATIDLGPYRGQSITLSFRNYSRYDNYYNTYTYVDDVRVEQ